ncbi:MAG: hypothetical protein OEL77_00740 [Nitrosopumilus sp.]|nr:hypothetical protein [Nitrosopumilus sp.]
MKKKKKRIECGVKGCRRFVGTMFLGTLHHGDNKYCNKHKDELDAERGIIFLDKEELDWWKEFGRD